MLRSNSVFEGNVFIEFDSVEEAKKAIEAKPMLEGKIVEIEQRKAKEDKPKKAKKENKKDAKKDKKDEKESYIKFTGISTDSNFASIKELFKLHGNPWLLYETKNDHGYLRFKSLEDAQEYLKRITEAKQLFDGKELEYHILEDNQIEQLIKEPVFTFVKFSGVDTQANFNEIKDLLKLHGNPWVIYENESDHGYLKFKSLEDAQEYIKKITEAKQLFNEKEYEYSVVTDQKEHNKLMKKESNSMRAKSKNKKGRGRRNKKK
jgi:hypothetical protein